MVARSPEEDLKQPLPSPSLPIAAQVNLKGLQFLGNLQDFLRSRRYALLAG